MAMNVRLFSVTEKTDPIVTGAEHIVKTKGYIRKAGWCPEGRKRVLLCLFMEEFDVSVAARCSAGGM